MIEIIFKEWKEKALRGRNKKVGKIIKNYWRLHYDANKDTVSFWQRPHNKSNTSEDIRDERYRIFTIDSQSQLTLNISNIYLYQSLKSILSNYIHLHMTIIPSVQREKYSDYDVHEFTHNGKKFIYVQNQTVFNTYGELIKLGDYIREEIDKEFNRKITKLSKAFREKLNVIGNLLNLNLTKSQILETSKHSKYTTNRRISIVTITEKEIYDDLHLDVLTKEVFIKWQKFTYLFDNSYIAFNKGSKKEPIMDVRKNAQKGINKKRKAIAKMQNKLNYIQVKQNVKGPGI